MPELTAGQFWKSNPIENSQKNRMTKLNQPSILEPPEADAPARVAVDDSPHGTDSSDDRAEVAEPEPEVEEAEPAVAVEATAQVQDEVETNLRI